MVPFHRFYQHGFIPEGLQRVAGGRSAAETAGSMKQKYSASRRDARQLLSEIVCRRSNISGTPSGVQIGLVNLTAGLNGCEHER